MASTNDEREHLSSRLVALTAQYTEALSSVGPF